MGEGEFKNLKYWIIMIRGMHNAHRHEHTKKDDAKNSSENEEHHMKM